MLTSRVLAALLATTTVVAATVALQLPASAEGELSRPLGPVLAIAHRGASGAAPEHTFFANDEAVRADVDFLECDLQLTKDGVLVCIHDSTVDRTSESSGRVDSFTLAELRQQDFGSWFNAANPSKARPEYVSAKVVPFEEQLDCYGKLNPRLRFHVETKVDPAYGDRLERGLVSLLARKGLLDTGDIQRSRVLVQSFDLASLERSKSLAPTLPTMFLSAAPPPDQLDGSTPSYVDGVSPNNAFLLANPSYITAAHSKGKVVHTYTVNDAQTMDALLMQGIDGIFSNEPALLRQRIDARGTGTTPEERGNPDSFAPLCPGVAGRVTSADGPGDGALPSPSASPAPATSASPAPASPAASGSPSASPLPVGSGGSSPAPSGTAQACRRVQVELPESAMTAGGSATVTASSSPGTDVELLAYTQPNRQYAVVRTARTGDDGRATFSVRPPANTRLYAREAGCSPDPGTAGSRVLDVRTALTLAARRVASRDYVFSGDSLPARRGGLIVSLYRLTDDGRQVLTGQARADSRTGEWSLPRKFAGSGRFGFVMRTGQDVQNAPGSSNVRPTVVH